jgi:phosphonate ABC transporter permease subunit PhnE
VLAIAVVLGIYAFAWQKTDISLDEVQDPQRSSSVKRAMTELLSPNIFNRDLERENIEIDVPFGCDDTNSNERTAFPEQHGSQPYIVIPGCVESGDIITLEGYNFHAGGFADMELKRESGQDLPFQPTGQTAQTFDIDDEGHFEVQLKVPRARGLTGVQPVLVRSGWYTGLPHFSDTTNDVVGKMLETLFLALIATTFAIPISVVISFLAAHNLMREIYLPLGTVLVGTVLLPVGGVLGYLLLGPVGNLGVDWGSDKVLLGLISAVLAIAAFGALSYFLNQLEIPHEFKRLVAFLRSLVMLAAIIFVVGALGGVGIWLGEHLAGDIPELAGGPAGTIGQLIDMTIVGLAALCGALLFASTGATVSADTLRKIHAPETYMLGAILGLISGGLLMAAMAYIGEQAVLLGLLPIFIAAILGAQVVYQLYKRAVGAAKTTVDLLIVDRISPVVAALVALWSLRNLIHNISLILDAWDIANLKSFLENEALHLAIVRDDATQGWFLIFAVTLILLSFFLLYQRKPDRSMKTVGKIAQYEIFAVGAVLLAVIAWYLLGAIRILDERTPSPTKWNFNEFVVSAYLAKAALIGAVLGGIAGGMSGTQTPFPLGLTIYNISRTILNALRSIEPLIMGIVFVIWVGVGPFAGVLALTLHSIASLGKLYSEQVESIDAGPMEAIKATGATRLQMIVYAVMPQIVPPYISFTMYRWDINVRMSTIIGFVGGGGIGFLLQQQINLLQYKQAGVAVLAIAIVVSILDYASAFIRERIV